MDNAVKDGKTLRFTAGSAISAGDLVQVGKYNGVAINDVANGASGTLAIEGVFTLVKKAGETHAIGDQLFLETGALTKTNSGALPLIGLAHEVQGTSAAVTTVCQIFPDLRMVEVS